jgi:hypothetical protein
VLRRLLIATLPAALVLAAAACGSDDTDAGTAAATTTVPEATTPTAAPCTAAVGSDFVAVEKHHLTHGAHHLGQGFALDTPQGRYLIANLYTIDDTLLASGLVWRIDAAGAASTVSPEANGYDNLPDVPADQAAIPPGLAGCQGAAG